MANIKQQRKRVKIAAREHTENLRYKSRIKTMFKSLTVTAQEDMEKASLMGLELVSLIDKAASRGVIHPNNASRKKSRVSSIVELAPGMKRPAGPATREPASGKSKKERRTERHEARATKETAVKEKQKARAESEAKAAEARAKKEAAEKAAAEKEAAAAEAEAPVVETEPEAEVEAEAPAAEAEAETEAESAEEEPAAEAEAAAEEAVSEEAAAEEASSEEEKPE